MDKTKLTIDAYDKNVEAYAHKFMAYRPYCDQVAEFITLLPEDAKILDLGCGPGNVARQLIGAGKKLTVVGVDLSEEMVKIARVNASQGMFFVQDIREAVFPQAHFDGIVLSFCIVHLSDQEAYDLMVKACEWLREGGLIYVSFMEGKIPGFETTSFSQEEIFFNYYDGTEVEYHLQRQGMEILHTSRQGYPEPDGSITTDVFIFGRLLAASSQSLV